MIGERAIYHVNRSQIFT